MSTEDIIRAWKDEDYRRCLTPEQQASLPPHPAGTVELCDEDVQWHENRPTHSRRIDYGCITR